MRPSGAEMESILNITKCRYVHANDVCQNLLGSLEDRTGSRQQNQIMPEREKRCARPMLLLCPRQRNPKKRDSASFLLLLSPQR